MKVLISGANGLVGSALVPALEAHGHQVVRLVRRDVKADGSERRWMPGAAIDPHVFDGIDAVVHLAGESILGRWTDAKKRTIRESRVAGTRTIAEGIARSAHPPKVLICASAIGYYGNRGDERLTESSKGGEGFLAEVSREWEAAAQAAADRGVRVVQLRTGIVLSRAGGALKQMLPPFKLGVGGRIGSGKQWMSWISLADLVDIFLLSLSNEAVRGAVNAVGPDPVDNTTFTRVLAKLLHRPALLPVPGFAPKLIFGAEMVDATILNSLRVYPEKLQAYGYNFRHNTLEEALRFELHQ